MPKQLISDEISRKKNYLPWNSRSIPKISYNNDGFLDVFRRYLLSYMAILGIYQWKISGGHLSYLEPLFSPWSEIAGHSDPAFGRRWMACLVKIWCHISVAPWKGVVAIMQWYCWWFRNRANRLRLVVYPIIYKVSYIPGGAGYLRSTIEGDSIHTS